MLIAGVGWKDILKKKKKKDEAYIRPLGNVAYFDSWKSRKGGLSI